MRVFVSDQRLLELREYVSFMYLLKIKTYLRRFNSEVMTGVRADRRDVQGAVVADTAGAGGEHVGLSGTPPGRQLRGHVLPSQVPHARRHLQQPPQPDARRFAVAAVEAAAAAIREQLQLSCRSVSSCICSR